MKTFLKKSLVLLAIIFSATIVTNFSTAAPTYAREMGDCDTSFLGLSNWDCGVDKDSWQGNDNLTKNIWLIAANISGDIIIIAAYLVLGYVIYGGYLYLLANGDASKVTAGKKTLIHAFTGLAIVMLAKIIVGTIHMALLDNTGAFGGEECLSDGSGCVNSATLVSNLIGWVIGISGLVAAAFVIIGAIGYLTSSGDSAKLQKAKNTILYALIGLAIVGLAQIITAVVTNAIKDSTKEDTSYNKTLIIAKELTHEK